MNPDVIIAASGPDRPERPASRYLTKAGERFGNPIVGPDMWHCCGTELVHLFYLDFQGPTGSRRRLARCMVMSH